MLAVLVKAGKAQAWAPCAALRELCELLPLLRELLQKLLVCKLPTRRGLLSSDLLCMSLRGKIVTSSVFPNR